jgi:hypothetical protein
MPKKPFVFFKNYDYANDPSGPGKGLYNGKMDRYKSVSDFRKRKKRRRAMLNILLQAFDQNLLVDPTEEFFNPPYNPAEISPMGLTDGIYPQEDLENKPSGNLYYGVTDTHWFPADDGETQEESEKDTSEKTESKHKD